VASLASPAVLWHALWPLVAAICAWTVLALRFWSDAVSALAAALEAALAALPLLPLGGWVPEAALWTARVLAAVALVPLVQLTALFLASAFVMPAMVKRVAAQRFPRLEQRRGGSLAGSLVNGLAALAQGAGLALATSPLWLIPPLWPLVAAALVGWINQRVLGYDALAEHADREERRAILRARRGPLWLLGAGIALVSWLPLAGLVAPLLMGLAFTHYLLAELDARRRKGGEHGPAG